MTSKQGRAGQGTNMIHPSFTIPVNTRSPDARMTKETQRLSKQKLGGKSHIFLSSSSSYALKASKGRPQVIVSHFTTTTLICNVICIESTQSMMPLRYSKHFPTPKLGYSTKVHHINNCERSWTVMFCIMLLSLGGKHQ